VQHKLVGHTNQQVAYPAAEPRNHETAS
jgi:hypothetical protein